MGLVFFCGVREPLLLLDPGPLVTILSGRLPTLAGVRRAGRPVPSYIQYNTGEIIRIYSIYYPYRLHINTYRSVFPEVGITIRAGATAI